MRKKKTPRWGTGGRRGEELLEELKKEEEAHKIEQLDREGD